MSYPALQIRTIGFATAERAMLIAQLQSYVACGFQWRVTESLDADALIANGKRCTVEQADTQHAELIVELPEGGFETVPILQIGCPILLTLPASDTLQQLPYFMWVGSAHGGDDIKNALHTLTQAMRYERILYALGAGLTEQGILFGPHLSNGERRNVHVQDGHHLVAVLDALNEKVYFNPQAEPEHAADWEWHKRPETANDHPEHFVEVTAEEALWEYAMRTPHVDLPERYMNASMSLLRMPQVRTSMMSLRHTSLLRKLSDNKFVQADDLSTINTTRDDTLERDLFALHLCGCLIAKPPSSPSSVPSWLNTLRSFIGAGNGRFPKGSKKPVYRDIEQVGRYDAQADNRFEGEARDSMM